MKIMDILVRDALVLDLVSTDKQAVLEELSSALARAEGQLDAERLLEVLTEREKLQSTGIITFIIINNPYVAQHIGNANFIPY